MNTTTDFVCRDLYLRHTDTSGKSTVREHRVWNAELFLTARVAEAKRLNSEVTGDAPRLASVEVISKSDYMKDRK